MGFERKDPYVKDLNNYLKQNHSNSSRESHFVNQMLFAAMIEARSCERFKILSEQLDDADLKNFYRMLVKSETRHFMTFLKFAKKYSSLINVIKRRKLFLEFEAGLMKKYGKEQTMQG